jgi:hypothetical protein
LSVIFRLKSDFYQPKYIPNYLNIDMSHMLPRETRDFLDAKYTAWEAKNEREEQHKMLDEPIKMYIENGSKIQHEKYGQNQMLERLAEQIKFQPPNILPPTPIQWDPFEKLTSDDKKAMKYT